MNNPTEQVADAGLQDRKRELLKYLLQQAGLSGDAEQAPRPTVRESRPEKIPLSYAQRRLWFIDQMEPGNVAYNCSTAVEMTGSLNIPALEQAANQIVERHESLRTCYRGGQEEDPWQVVLPFRGENIPVVDLTGLNPRERETQSRLLADMEAWRPFDPSKWPLMRLRVLRLENRKFVLTLAAHHIVIDGWSLAIFFKELNVFNRAALSGSPAALPKLEMQYPDFAVRQDRWLRDGNMAREIAYWKRQLDGSPVTEIPGSRSRPKVHTYSGNRFYFSIDGELSERIARYSASGVTEYMVLVAGFKVLLMKYSGEEDIAIGTPVANRNREEVEPLIGFFVNTLVLRTTVSQQSTFEDVLKRVKEVALEAYSYQDVPFEKVVEELKPERRLSHSPLFQIMFVLQSTGLDSLTLEGMQLKEIELEGKTAKFDITVELRRIGEGLRGCIEYNTDLYDRVTIQRMANHYVELMGSVIDDGSRRIAEYEMLTEWEKAQVVTEWNIDAAEFSKDVVKSFVEQSSRTPDRVAVVMNGAELSYSELHRRTNGLGNLLMEYGIEPESLVGICLERGLDMVVALIGVMKAGGAYVGLDPAYPEERLKYMVEDSGCSVLITTKSAWKDMPLDGRKVIDADKWGDQLNSRGAGAPDVVIDGQNIAYVIYTSGSTGKPKGVAIARQSVGHLMQWARDTYSEREMEGVYAATSICFDLSVFEIMAPLTVGGSVIMGRSGLDLIGSEYGDRVTLINTVPSVMSELIRLDGVPKTAGVVNLAGEVLTQELADRVLSLGTVTSLNNLYGPTEDTTYSTGTEVDKGVQPSIGRGLKGSSVFVLDKGLQAVAIGVRGELFIGGGGLARGYLGKPALTADRFIPEPFGHTGRRLYRTGDLAKYASDGTLDFIGRIDDQVKVRGFRIELGEIEAMLENVDGVEKAVVTVNGSAGEARLAAYVKPAPGAEVSRDQLALYLREHLPEYMLPSGFVILEEFPMTPNGKVDRKKLPSPEVGLRERDRGPDSRAPRTPTQEVMAGIWQDVLAVDAVGLDENFFDLGGHSLLATQLIARISESFKIGLPLKVAFEHTTLRKMSTEVERLLIAAIAQTSDEEALRMLREA